MPRIIDKERAEILQSTDEFIIDSAINGTRKVSFDTLKESLGASGGSGNGGSANIEVDGALSSSSTNPVQNKVINTAINQTLAAAKSYTDNKVSNKMDQVTLATVATTGNYNDLKNKPTLPNLSNLAKVATSGSYNDLTDCPAIPEVPTLVSELTNDVGYITEDDLPVLPVVPTKVSELTNDSGFITSADLPEPVTVPTKTSELTNDSGFITAEALPEFQNVPTKVSELTNDAGYITSADVPTKVSQLTNDSSFITEEGVQSKIDTALTSVYKWKGSVANKDALPTSDNKIGDVYDTQDTGMNYGWNGASWDSLGALVSGGYTKPEGGVPKADLAEDVQQSLEKADTALQSETQPDWNATSGAAAILNKPTKLSDFSNEDTQFITLNDLPEDLGTTYTPGDGINIKNNTISTTSRIVDITQVDYDKLTDEQKNANDIWYSIIDAKSSVVDYTQPFRFGIDADGNYGYYKVGADTVTPFKSGGDINYDKFIILSGSALPINGGKIKDIGTAGGIYTGATFKDSSKDWEIQIKVLINSYPEKAQGLIGSPNELYDGIRGEINQNGGGKFVLCSTSTYTSDTISLYFPNNTYKLNTWYYIRIKYIADEQILLGEISIDGINYTLIDSKQTNGLTQYMPSNGSQYTIGSFWGANYRLTNGEIDLFETHIINDGEYIWGIKR